MDAYMLRRMLDKDYVTIGILMLAAIIAYYFYSKSNTSTPVIVNPNVQY